jgi:hypothetical protein
MATRAQLPPRTPGLTSSLVKLGSAVRAGDGLALEHAADAAAGDGDGGDGLGQGGRCLRVRGERLGAAQALDRRAEGWRALEGDERAHGAGAVLQPALEAHRDDGVAYLLLPPRCPPAQPAHGLVCAAHHNLAQSLGVRSPGSRLRDLPLLGVSQQVEKLLTENLHPREPHLPLGRGV